MSLQVNFTTHGKDLRVTYEDILNSSSANDWALFGYDKGTNDLKVLGTGSGGLEELQDEFVDGKIQYAFVRVVDPNSNLNKFVLIGWCGDGVPESKKGLFNTHLADVSRFLKGYHLQINARSEDDVTPQQIMKRIDEASASKYSYHKETAKGRDLITPLQSAYKKTEIPDIAALQRSSKQEPVAPLQSAYKKTEVPDIASLQRSAPKPESAPKVVFGASSSTPASSTSSIASRWNPQGATSSSSTSTTSSTTTPPASSSSSSWRSGGGSSYVPPTSSNSFNRVAPPASLANYTVDRNEPTMNKAVQMRLEREQREREERARIEQEIKAREAREAEQQQKESAAKQAEERRLQQEREQREQRERDEQERKERERAAAQEVEMSARAAREAAKAREQGEIEAARERARKEEAAREEEARRREEEEARRREEEEARRREEAEARRKAEEEERERERERARRQAEEEEREARRLQEQQEEEARRRQQELEEEVQAATAQSVNLGADALIASSEHPERAAGQAKTAVVLYSYEAAEANEMSLIEGEIIYNVSELDVGWWSGESEDGSRSGLFPANYVELIEHQPTDVPNGTPPAAAAGSNVAAAGTPNVHEEGHHAAQQGTGASDKPSALALYDYVAGEPNEISFNEGETIVDIEQITEDWWQGMNQKGDIGLFPANYVELHQ